MSDIINFSIYNKTDICTKNPEYIQAYKREKEKRKEQSLLYDILNLQNVVKEAACNYD